MMLEIPSRRDALPPAGVGGGARDKSLTCRYTRLEPIVSFFDENGGFFLPLFVRLIPSYRLCVCVGTREVSIHLQVVMSYIEVLQ